MAEPMIVVMTRNDEWNGNKQQQQIVGFEKLLKH
jgi:hypothetical protein